jgi:predicted O-methyltransferase YrrM
LSLELCRPGAIIIGDNVIRKGRMADFASTDPDLIGLRKYIELLGSRPKLDSPAVQTVGAKGWDGFSISILSA